MTYGLKMYLNLATDVNDFHSVCNLQIPGNLTGVAKLLKIILVA